MSNKEANTFDLTCDNETGSIKSKKSSSGVLRRPLFRSEAGLPERQREVLVPHSVNTYRERAQAQFREASDALDDGSRTNHLELAEIFRARADLIAALSALPETPAAELN